MECQAKSIMERCGCLPYYFPEFGEVWGNVSHLGHLDWADTTCNHTQWLCLATYTGNHFFEYKWPSYLPLGQPTWA